MNRLVLLIVLFTSTALARQEVLQFPDSASLAIEVPDGWFVAAPKGPRPGFPFFTIPIRPKDQRNAACLITVFSGNERRASDIAFLRKLLEGDSAPWIANAPEQKMTQIEELSAKHMKGVFARFVDAKLIGKPVKPRDYKTTTAYILAVDGACLVKATVLCDDFAGTEFKEAAAMISSVSLAKQ